MECISSIDGGRSGTGRVGEEKIDEGIVAFEKGKIVRLKMNIPRNKDFVGT